MVIIIDRLQGKNIYDNIFIGNEFLIRISDFEEGGEIYNNIFAQNSRQVFTTIQHLELKYIYSSNHRIRNNIFFGNDFPEHHLPKK